MQNRMFHSLEQPLIIIRWCSDGMTWAPLDLSKVIMYNVKQPTEEDTHTRLVMDVRVSTSMVTLDSIEENEDLWSTSCHKHLKFACMGAITMFGTRWTLLYSCLDVLNVFMAQSYTSKWLVQWMSSFELTPHVHVPVLPNYYECGCIYVPQTVMNIMHYFLQQEISSMATAVCC